MTLVWVSPEGLIPMERVFIGYKPISRCETFIIQQLQIVLELEIESCAGENDSPQRGWIVRSHVGWKGEQSISHFLSCENLSLTDVF